MIEDIPFSGDDDPVLKWLQVILVTLAVLYLGRLMFSRIRRSHEKRMRHTMMCIVRRKISENILVMLVRFEESHLFSHRNVPGVACPPSVGSPSDGRLTLDGYMRRGTQVSNTSFALWGASFQHSVLQHLHEAIEEFLVVYRLPLLSDPELLQIAADVQTECTNHQCWGLFSMTSHLSTLSNVKNMYREFHRLFLCEYCQFMMVLRRMRRPFQSE